jgi:hypothetical protein
MTVPFRASLAGPYATAEQRAIYWQAVKAEALASTLVTREMVLDEIVTEAELVASGFRLDLETRCWVRPEQAA